MPQPEPIIHVVRRACRGVVPALAVTWAVFAAGWLPAARGAAADLAPATSAACIDDVWFVSTRHLPGICRLPDTADVAVERRSACGRWQRADVAELLAGSDQPLVVFVHGNRYTVGDARQQGLQFARHITASRTAVGPVRTVVFSWPSEQQTLPLRDGRLKYERAHADAHYLAWLLGQIEPTRPVAVVGYSFGALITLGAIDDLVAAERSGRGDVQPWRHRPGRTNVVFVAPAVRCDALATRGPYRETTDCFDRLTIVINSRDDALKFFPLLDRNLHADALGYVGMPRRWLPPHVDYTATDARAIIGRNHGLPLYLASPKLSSIIATGALDGLH